MVAVAYWALVTTRAEQGKKMPFSLRNWIILNNTMYFFSTSQTLLGYWVASAETFETYQLKIWQKSWFIGTVRQSAARDPAPTSRSAPLSTPLNGGCPDWLFPSFIIPMESTTATQHFLSLKLATYIQPIPKLIAELSGTNMRPQRRRVLPSSSKWNTMFAIL